MGDLIPGVILQYIHGFCFFQLFLMVCKGLNYMITKSETVEVHITNFDSNYKRYYTVLTKQSYNAHNCTKEGVRANNVGEFRWTMSMQANEHTHSRRQSSSVGTSDTRLPSWQTGTWGGLACYCVFSQTDRHDNPKHLPEISLNKMPSVSPVGGLRLVIMSCKTFKVHGSACVHSWIWTTCLIHTTYRLMLDSFVLRDMPKVVIDAAHHRFSTVAAPWMLWLPAIKHIKLVFVVAHVSICYTYVSQMVHVAESLRTFACGVGV